MQEAVTRKLIDIKSPTILALSIKAKRKGVSLKRYIEDLLEESVTFEDLPAPKGVTDRRILSLIGMAKPVTPIESIEDEKLKYILSK
ncbi:MAG: hypothetical protein J6Y06_07315 [Bacteroidales bacterium]|nr:hypothetical protein [Bacteroidales bacterium]